MKFWTAHIRAGAAPELVREGFSWGALIFGPLWLAAHRAWIAAVLTLVAWVLIIVLTQDGVSAALLTTVIVLLACPASICAAGRSSIAAICLPRSWWLATNWRRWGGSWNAGLT